MNEANHVFQIPATPVQSALHKACIALHESEVTLCSQHVLEVDCGGTWSFEPPIPACQSPSGSGSWPGLCRNRSPQASSSRCVPSGSAFFPAACWLDQPGGWVFERLLRVLEVLAKRRKVELEKLVQQMSLPLSPTFIPVLGELELSHPVPSAHPPALLGEAQNLLTEYKDKQKVVQCSAWQTEAHAADDMAKWLQECCLRLRQDTYFLESAISKARAALKGLGRPTDRSSSSPPPT